MLARHNKKTCSWIAWIRCATQTVCNVQKTFCGRKLFSTFQKFCCNKSPCHPSLEHSKILESSKVNMPMILLLYAFVIFHVHACSQMQTLSIFLYHPLEIEMKTNRSKMVSFCSHGALFSTYSHKAFGRWRARPNPFAAMLWNCKGHWRQDQRRGKLSNYFLEVSSRTVVPFESI